MEHRTFKRQPVSLPLRLMISEGVVVTVHSLEISPGGACIRDPGMGLKSNQVLQVQLRGASQHACSTRAMVIYRDAGKVGLMFDDIIPLHQLLS